MKRTISKFIACGVEIMVEELDFTDESATLGMEINHIVFTSSVVENDAAKHTGRGASVLEALGSMFINIEASKEIGVAEIHK